MKIRSRERKKRRYEQVKRQNGSSEKKRKEEVMPTDNGVKCQSCGGHHPTFKCRKSTRACFRCGNKDHFIKDCPMNPKQDSNSRPQTQAQVFSLSDSIITGTI
ncbi:hypothetical protein AXF42_Ash017936 [Apostasia shenzhenica]|uniref:CCHC-type domain-containing protein n=1 Tax=Apostasia shenzhenica TaxID=1088818 RepID=A0A2I0AYA5_9ASPA|nr:hypothetical protein AXF42_Ash017936 [Apostasia shenzhenica]